MAKKPSLHTLSRQMPQGTESQVFQQELISGSDRSSALVGCAGIDSAIVYALKCKMIYTTEANFDDYFYGQSAVLGSFSQRIRTGFMLGIYDIKFSQHLDVIRRIRNYFAHSMILIGFDHELIQKECQKLPIYPQTDDGKLGQLHPNRRIYIQMCFVARFLLVDYAQKNLVNSTRIVPSIAGVD